MVQGTKVNADEAEAAIEGEGERASERQQDEVGRGRTVWGGSGRFSVQGAIRRKSMSIQEKR